MYKHILIPTDGSELSTTALESALDFAHEIGAEATVLVVMEPMHVMTLNPAGLEIAYAEYDRQNNKAADDILAQADNAAKQRSVTCKTMKLSNSDAAHTIIATAESQNCDLIVMASHGRSGFKAFMLGSVTMKVLANSKTPVLIYR